MRERIQNGPRKSKNTNYKYKKTHEKKGQTWVVVQSGCAVFAGVGACQHPRLFRTAILVGPLPRLKSLPWQACGPQFPRKKTFTLPACDGRNLQKVGQSVSPGRMCSTICLKIVSPPSSGL